MSSDWIKNLKVGDKVIVHYAGRGFVPRSVQIVTKINKTTVVVGRDLYSLAGVSRGGDAWSKTYIFPYTEEEENKILLEEEHRKLQFYLSNRVKWDDLPIEKLREIYKIVNEDGHE